MPRIVALDVGDATVGVAATDELGVAVHPVTTLRRGRGVKADLREVEALLEELDASLVVVGMPLDPDGQEGPQARSVRDFVDRLSRRIRTPVRTWDERFSTSDAEQRLLDADVSRAKRRKIIDQAAAVVILESYLAAGEQRETSSSRSRKSTQQS